MFTPTQQDAYRALAKFNRMYEDITTKPINVERFTIVRNYGKLILNYIEDDELRERVHAMSKILCHQFNVSLR